MNDSSELSSGFAWFIAAVKRRPFVHHHAAFGGIGVAAVDLDGLALGVQSLGPLHAQRREGLKSSRSHGDQQLHQVGAAVDTCQTPGHLGAPTGRDTHALEGLQRRAGSQAVRVWRGIGEGEDIVHQHVVVKNKFDAHVVEQSVGRNHFRAVGDFELMWLAVDDATFNLKQTIGTPPSAHVDAPEMQFFSGQVVVRCHIVSQGISHP